MRLRRSLSDILTRHAKCQYLSVYRISHARFGSGRTAVRRPHQGGRDQTATALIAHDVTENTQNKGVRRLLGFTEPSSKEKFITNWADNVEDSPAWAAAEWPTGIDYGPLVALVERCHQRRLDDARRHGINSYAVHTKLRNKSAHLQSFVREA